MRQVRPKQATAAGEQGPHLLPKSKFKDKARNEYRIVNRVHIAVADSFGPVASGRTREEQSRQ